MQIDYMEALGIIVSFDDLTCDDWIEIEDVVSEILCFCGFDKNYEPTKDGIMCESILDIIP